MRFDRSGGEIGGGPGEHAAGGGDRRHPLPVWGGTPGAPDRKSDRPCPSFEQHPAAGGHDRRGGRVFGRRTKPDAPGDARVSGAADRRQSRVGRTGTSSPAVDGEPRGRGKAGRDLVPLPGGPDRQADVPEGRGEAAQGRTHRPGPGQGSPLPGVDEETGPAVGGRTCGQSAVAQRKNARPGKNRRRRNRRIGTKPKPGH